MGINARDKGQNGEREIADLLNGHLMIVMREMGFPQDKIVQASTTIQRNQNQSAVGGSDLSNTFGLSIEIKRQEALSIGSWWTQCEAAATRNMEWPVLIYKQNHKPWRVVTYAELGIPDGRTMKVRAEMDFKDFQMWFREWARAKISQGHQIRQ